MKLTLEENQERHLLLRKKYFSSRVPPLNEQEEKRLGELQEKAGTLLDDELKETLDFLENELTKNEYGD